LSYIALPAEEGQLSRSQTGLQPKLTRKATKQDVILKP